MYREDSIDEQVNQDDLFDQVESAYLGTASGQASQPASTGHSPSYSRDYSVTSNSPRLHFDAPSTFASVPNGYHRRSGSSRLMTYYDQDEEGVDSDAEAAAGLEAMRMAEEQEEVERRSHDGNWDEAVNGTEGIQHYDEEEFEDEEDYHAIDLSMYGGGYEPQVSYGGYTPSSATQLNPDLITQHPSTSSRESAPTDGDSFPPRTSSNTSMTAGSAHQSHGTPYGYDTIGAGGLNDLSHSDHERRMSFDKDDDTAYVNEEADQPAPQDHLSPSLINQSAPSVTRPLPAVPSEDSHMQYPSLEELQSNQFFAPESMPQYPADPNAYEQQNSSSSSMEFPRSRSLGVHSHVQQTVPPARSKTDAEERKRMTMIRASTYGSQGGFENLPSETATSLGIDLPSIPATRHFQPSKLSSRDFNRCEEPWAISSVMSWLRSISEGETELKEYALVEALVNLFTFKVSTMSIAEAENLSTRVISDMYEAGYLLHEEEWLRFGSGDVGGVLFQLTGQGCYAPSLHEHESPDRCYSHHCQRTVKKINIEDHDARQAADWASYFKLKKEDVEDVSKKEVERQNNLYEIVQSEYKYMDNLKTLRVVYKDALESAQPSILPPKSLSKFLKEVFGKLDSVQKANEEFLLPQLNFRQQEQGPWVVGFSDIFRDWVRKAKTAYIDYSANFPNADFLMRQESRKNMLFSAFLEGARNNKMSGKLPWDSFLKAPITKLQRYPLLLSSVHRNMQQDSEEKANLATAIEEIRAITRECDARLAEAERKVTLSDLQSKLIFRPDMKRVDLNLTQWGRELIYVGELQRTGANRFTWLDTHAILLDNYLILAKTVSQRDSKSDQYDVSKAVSQIMPDHE